MAVTLWIVGPPMHYYSNQPCLVLLRPYSAGLVHELAFRKKEKSLTSSNFENSLLINSRNASLYSFFLFHWKETFYKFPLWRNKTIENILLQFPLLKYNEKSNVPDVMITNHLMQFEYFQAALGDSNMGFLSNSMCTSTATSPGKEHVLPHNDLV